MFRKTGWLSKVILVGIFILVGLRFVNLEADFPPDITTSGVLYTDEGWYSNSAIAHLLTGNWYIEGDFNPAVNLPLFPLIQLLSFKILGLSLTSSRITIIIFFVLLLTALYYLVKIYTNERSALTAIALMSLSYFYFAYSRLAILEIPMTFFLVLSLYLASISSESKGYLFIALSSLAFLAAILTKTSVIFALPLWLYIILRKEIKWQNKLTQTAILTVILLAGLALYYALVVQDNLEDYRYFTSLNITSRFNLDSYIIARGMEEAILKGQVMDEILYPLAIFYSLILFFTVKQLRQNTLFCLSLLWVFLYWLMLGLNQYTPPRYYLPLAIPIIIVIAIMLDYLLKEKKKSLLTWLFVTAMLVSIMQNSFFLIKYLNTPEYSFINMAGDIKQHILRDGSSKPVILGNFANSISLASGIFSINDRLGTKDLNYRIEKYRPNYYVSLGQVKPEVDSVLGRYYKRVKLIKIYDVFGNYYAEGYPVFFYKLVSF